jgi:hypothetical protein
MKMKRKSRKSTFSASIILLLAMSMLIAGATSANAATSIKTRAFLSANPNPVQVGQSIVVSFWVEPIPPTAADIFHGFMIEVTGPDGNKETKGPFSTSPLGSQYMLYTPDKTGEYKFQFSYPGESFAGDVHFEASQSPITTVVVQDGAIEPSFVNVPVPTDYWTRPINAQNRDWFSISGNWLMRNYNATYRSFGEVLAANPYSQAVRAPHVMWTKELTLGGLVGGDFKAGSYYTGQSYEPKLTPPIILNGRLYCNIYPSSLFGSSYTGFQCIDLRTGEVLWTNPDYSINYAQVLMLSSGNEAGAIAMLWQVDFLGTYTAFDAFTGQKMLSFENGAAGTTFFGSDGTMFVDVLNVEKGWNALWNSTKAFEGNFMYLGTDPGITMFTPRPGTYDWSLGIQWNVTVPVRSVTLPEDGLTYYVGTGFLSGITGNVLVGAAGTVTDARLHAGYDLTTGRELWVADRTNDQADYIVFAAFGEGKYCAWDTANMRWVCYDVQTGKKLWTSDEAVYPWGCFLPNSNGGTISNGVLYYGAMDGYLHAVSMSDGKELWKKYAGDTTETAYGTYPMGSGPIIAGDVVYIGIGEHSPTHPLYRGGKLFAYTLQGDLLWEMNGYFSLAAIADGYLLAQNQYDNMIYCFGKGPSATTVSAPDVGVPTGSLFVISGTVKDMSAGQSGTAAIADRDMGKYMAYLKEQQPTTLSSLAGVPVKLTARAPDGNILNIGEVTSDASGYFMSAWSTTTTGLYQVTATFPGTDSYGSSFATTAFLAVAGSGGNNGSTQAAASNTDLYIIISTIVIVIVIVLAALFIRGKK